MPKPNALPGNPLGKNLSYTQDGNILSLHIDTSVPATENPKTGKSTVASSGGFAAVGGIKVAINAIEIQ